MLKSILSKINLFKEKRMNENQQQSLGDASTAIQAGGDVHYGITYTEARSIALDVAKATFYELTGVAKETAGIRVEEITEQVLKKISETNPEHLNKAVDPDFQFALSTVQKEYARTGDKDLGDLLVDLLVDRSKLEKRDILQIVLNESLDTAPKLTESHLAALAIIFLFGYTQNHTIGNHQILGEYLDRFVMPFKEKLPTNDAAYQHLEFSRCGSIMSFGERNLEQIFGMTYQGQFMKGFEASVLESMGIPLALYNQYFIPCLNDLTKLQVRANSQETLEKFLNANVLLSEDIKNKIIQLFNTNKMTDDEIKQKVTLLRPYMTQVFDVWTTSSMKSFTLTSVGIAIGHANIKRFSGEFADLRIWIN